MPKDIKVKDKESHYIRRLDRKIAFASRVKRNVSNEYDRLKSEENNGQEIENSNASNYASTKIMRTGDRGARESTHIVADISKSVYQKAKMRVYNSNEIMKKSKLQNVKQNNIRIKNVFQKIGKALVNSSKKAVHRNRNVNCYWRWNCFSNTHNYFVDSRNAWFSLWLLIF